MSYCSRVIRARACVPPCLMPTYDIPDDITNKNSRQRIARYHHLSTKQSVLLIHGDHAVTDKRSIWSPSISPTFQYSHEAHSEDRCFASDCLVVTVPVGTAVLLGGLGKMAKIQAVRECLARHELRGRNKQGKLRQIAGSFALGDQTTVPSVTVTLG